MPKRTLDGSTRASRGTTAREKRASGSKPVGPKSKNASADVKKKTRGADGAVRPATREAAATGGVLDRKLMLEALTALKKGNFSVRLPIDWEGLDGKIADTFNDVVELNSRVTSELERVSRVVGKEGRIGDRAAVAGLSGAWAHKVGSVNALISDLVHPTSEMARVIGAVAKGDLSQAMALEVDGRPLEGEFLRTAKTVNTMVDQLGSFASEVTRVAR
ncbi:MAG TPA: HAMP domain-containing protein, partial [Polyangium sp.]|nr:HAMP domain-containing protein [Polyangium sp.]